MPVSTREITFLKSYRSHTPGRIFPVLFVRLKCNSTVTLEGHSDTEDGENARTGKKGKTGRRTRKWVDSGYFTVSQKVNLQNVSLEQHNFLLVVLILELS